MPITVTACALGLLIHARVFDVWLDPSTPVTIHGGVITGQFTYPGAWPLGVPIRWYGVKPIVPGGDVLVSSAGPLEVWAYGEVETAVVAETAAVPVLAYAPVVVRWAGPADYNADGVAGDDKDIEDFWACLAGRSPPHCTSDFNGDSDAGVDSDVEDFYRALAGHAQP